MFLTLGYHGCDQATAQQLLGGLDFVDSERDYDWLGKGVYFWESDPQRALEWAKKRGKTPPSVVGAVIDLGECLDLTSQRGLRALKLAYKSFAELQTLAGQALPKNEDPKGVMVGDKVLRRLDRAVIEHLHSMQAESVKRGFSRKEFETVKALFPEGIPLYEDAGFRSETHVQLCVREHRQIRGVFRIPEWQLDELNLESLYTFS